MRREVVFAVSALALVILVGAGVVQEVTRTFVVNLKDPHPIEGSVSVPEPVPHSAVERIFDVVVAPARREQTSLWSEAGFLETAGFTSVVLSLHGQLRGDPTVPGAVAVVLVPDEENVLRSFDEGEVHLALEAFAEPVPTGGLYFSGSEAGLPVAFERYRVFLYNTTDRSASVNIFIYLTH